MFFRQWMVSGIVLILAVALYGCNMFPKEVKLEDVPPAARSVIQSHTSGGTIEKITRKKEEGKHYYKVKYKKDGRESKLEVDENGKVLKMEEILAMKDLPPAVQKTVKAKSAGGKIEELELETEDGKTFYEIEFEKDGKEYKLKVAKDGTVLEYKKE